MSKIKQYEVNDGKLIRKKEFCPKEDCGPGVFLAVHKDRVSCGKCGYTKFNQYQSEEFLDNHEKSILLSMHQGLPSLEKLTHIF